MRAFSLFLPLMLSCMPNFGDTGVLERVAFEDKWWYSDKLDFCVCFNNAHPDAAYSEQLLIYDVSISDMYMLSSWEFLPPNAYRAIPLDATSAEASIIFHVSEPDDAEHAECWEVELETYPEGVSLREIMCECKYRGTTG